MSIRKILFFLTLLLGGTIHSQELISHTFLGSKTKDQLTAQFGVPFLQYGVRCYKVWYTTFNLEGKKDTVSGLMAVPDAGNLVFPRLLYQHGTSSSQYNVPSSYGDPLGQEGDIPVVFAAMGFVSLAPDYLGLGDSDGFHPYVHAASEAWVGADFLRTIRSNESIFGIQTNYQLFVTGYSQGGHASMAFHRAAEQEWPFEFEITAAAHLSGPYSIGEVMRDLILSESVYYYPGYIPNTILSYQEVYGNLFSSISDLFRSPYDQYVSQFYAGTLSLGDLNSTLIDELTTIEGSCKPSHLLKDSIRQVVETQLNHPINLALKANNVYRWAPQAPTRIFYCQADDQVPFQNSIQAADTMNFLGAPDVEAVDINSQLNHTQCVEPAITAALFFFLPFQEIGDPTFVQKPTIGESAAATIALFPNPAHSFLQAHFPKEGTLLIYNLTGQAVYSTFCQTGLNNLDISALGQGVYLAVTTVEGSFWQQKLIIK